MSNYQGLAVGGPYDGQKVISRNPKGFVLVDKPNSRAWVYDFQGDRFVAREGDTFDPYKGWRAAESDGWDVLAFDPEGVPSGH